MRHLIPCNVDMVLMSNFTAKATAAVGQFRGMSAFGAYDMAGNVKEWTMNAAGSHRYALGGAWSESTYVFLGESAAENPFRRTTALGFRCVKRPTPPADNIFAALQFYPTGPARTTKPVGDENYREFETLHQYERRALEAKTEGMDNVFSHLESGNRVVPRGI